MRLLWAKERSREFLEREKAGNMVDVVHKAALLWERNDRTGLQELLKGCGYPEESIRALAQAIADVLPEGDDERRLLQGLLGGWPKRAEAEHLKLGY